MIGVVDYGLGNLKAFLNIYKRLNVPCQLVSTPGELESADKLILPGVGAFDHAMEELASSGLRDSLDHQVLHLKKPVLGICVGMQMMAESSEEGVEEGLGWIKGSVKKLQLEDYPGCPLPHMGWNLVHQEKDIPLFNDIKNDSEFYFLHSYYFSAASQNDVIATALYPQSFAAMVNKGNIYGIQCHPEKSHQQGITILKNFSEVG